MKRLNQSEYQMRIFVDEKSIEHVEMGKWMNKVQHY